MAETWTYDSTAPGATAKDYVRLRVGDTTSADQLLQDAEILAVISAETNTLKAASICAQTIAGKYARKVDKTVGKLAISMSQASARYSEMADDLLRESGRKAGAYAGGISIADKEDTEADTDRVAPVFTMGQFDYDGADSTEVDCGLS